MTSSFAKAEARTITVAHSPDSDDAFMFYALATHKLDTGKFRRVSPGIGKTTCGYFRPDGKKIIFASTHLDPNAKMQYAEEYKRREEEARKAKLTAEQALQEERDALAQENTRLKQQGLQSRIAAEFKLPASLAARLIGSDEDSLRADAEELSKLLPKPKAGSPTDPVREQNGKRVYKRSELQADPTLARSPEVRQAAREGRISND